jgi:ketosteroid isomerase-like protein
MNVKEIFELKNSAFNKAFNSGDVNALVELYAVNAILSPGNGQVLVGRSELEKLFTSFIDGGVHDHTLEILETGSDENMIYQVAKWGAKGEIKDGELPAYGGITTNVLHKNADGTWLTHSHIWNVNQ